MKEAVTKFDFESAFKALNEIDIPAVGKVQANRPALTEIFSRKSKLDALMEEYYDIDSTEELGDAKSAREAEVAKAKLARIEKIVDLDADSSEDLLTSYVGKNIIQCPQCMTLFYKDPEDIVKSEEDPNTVNVNEICQHCGNETGYTLIGKVGEAEPGEFEEPAAAELPEEIPEAEEIPEETATEEPAPEEDLEGLEELDLDITDDEEPKEESFNQHEGEALVEELADDKELDEKLDAHDKFIEYLRATLASEEEKLEKEDNEEVKAILQRNIETLKADLESALPEAVKTDLAVTEEPIEDTVEAAAVEETEVQEESCEVSNEGDTLTEALHEEKELDVSADEFEELIKSPEFTKPISDSEARAMINAEETEESVDESLEENVLTELFGNKVNRADWLLSNIPVNFKTAKFNTKGELISDKRFKTFLVVAFENDLDGKPIKKIPSLTDERLVPINDDDNMYTCDKFEDAQNKANEWSAVEGLNGEISGPTIIYLANNKDGEDALPLCMYFKGKPYYADTIKKYYDRVSQNLAKIKKLNKDATVEDQPDESSAAPEIKKIKASEVQPEQTIKHLGKTYFVTGVEKKSWQGKERCNFTAKLVQNGKKTSIIARPAINPDTEVELLDEGTTTSGKKPEDVAESFSTTPSISPLSEQLDEVQDASLETFIADSLVESYGNVAGFKLTECAYAGNKLTVNGTIYFTSGNTRKTTYTFNESYNTEDGKVSMQGLNEKLGLDKQFTLTGRIENKTLITESFKRSK
jgi:hypothetical protein